ncbi:MAG: DUF1992 domain-containing protein [Geodermatophilaceae bacterium]|nr:DUF1992 domain-containing protein [Geodermatophilaceae bacterium]MDQ3454008.1 DUF1992 domain-containing protein [Actinomycetota bacterium]
MTERKPAGMSFETWVEKQIREAKERGDFENLSGAGKPIPGRGQPDDELWWLKGYLAREQLDFALPNSLRLRKEIEDLPGRVDRERREYAVRHVVDDLNERIHQENRLPTPGPPLNRMPVDVEAVVTAWQDRRTAQVPAPAPEPPVEAPRRRWWRLRREVSGR